MRKNLHFRRIPDYIERELENIRSQYVVVAAIIDTTKNNVSNGEFKRFGIQTKEGEIEIPDSVSPDKLSGLYARYNRNGKVWVLRDLPKITKTYSWESPNFGDPEKGYHTTYIDREVYQRKLEPSRDWEIVFSIISVQADKVRIKAQISAVLDKQNVDFRKDLFLDIISVIRMPY